LIKNTVDPFDSGRYVVPSIKILSTANRFLTDSLLVEVANVQVDTLKQKKCLTLRTLSSNLIGKWKLIIALIVGIEFYLLVY
jgi:hypothetical protein